MLMRLQFIFCFAAIGVYAYQQQPVKTVGQAKLRAASAAAAAALSVLLSTSQPSFASTQTAAQIQLDKIPPSSISVHIEDLPIIGNLLSGTYTKVPDGSFTETPSITITSPTDKVKAIQSIISGGHLEFDVDGKIKTHLDVDIAADEPGVARFRVASNLIPKLPFRNLASLSASSPTGGKESAWNVVTNLGSGESYYYNMKTGVTQLDRPDKF